MKLRWSLFLFLFAFIYGGCAMASPLSEKIRLSGRFHVSDSCVCASAPAVTIEFAASTREVSFDIEGDSRFRFDIDGRPVSYFETKGRMVKKLAASPDGVHLYRLVKISESNPGKICIRSVNLRKGDAFADLPKPTGRRIEFIGDSFTVGYGDEAKGPDDGTVYEKTDASKSYAFLVADYFKAEFQVNAVSGRGLVHNYGGIVPEWTLSSLYDYTLPGAIDEENSPLWDFERFHPQVVVVFVGINDFQGDPPHASVEDFKHAYASLLDKIRHAHEGVKFLLVSTKTWPDDSLTPVVEEIYREELEKGHDDLEYKLVFTENSGLHGHPSEMSQKELANTIRPIVGRLGRWISR